MKRRTYIKFKSKKAHDLFHTKMIGSFFQEYEEQIKTGEIQLDWADWTEQGKSYITIDMDSTEENILKWTKMGIRDRMVNKVLSPLMTIETITLEEDKSQEG